MKKVESKENKKVSFKVPAGDQEDWQEVELEKSRAKVAELTMEVTKLQRLLTAKNYDQVYKENDMMRKELKSMQVLLDENTTLKEDVDRLRTMSYDDRVAEVGAENARLRRRNGELLFRNSELEDEILELQKGAPAEKSLPSRPNTAAVGGRRDLEEDLTELVA